VGFCVFPQPFAFRIVTGGVYSRFQELISFYSGCPKHFTIVAQSNLPYQRETNPSTMSESDKPTSKEDAAPKKTGFFDGFVNAAQKKTSMEGMVDNAIRTCKYALNPNSPGVPKKLLEVCSGVAILNSAQAGFLVSASGGTGIILRRDMDTGKWSPPSAIGSGGVGFGLVFGADLKDILIVLIDEASVKTLSGEAQVKLGGQMGVAVGPLGREVEGGFALSNKGAGMTFTYTYSKGLFAGINMEGAVLGARNAENKTFYGKDDISPEEILFKEGSVTVPEASAGKVEELQKLLTLMEQGRSLEE
jgi:lipid-binding SYLF domain-containing protein